MKLIVLNFTLNLLKRKGEAEVMFRETHLENDALELWITGNEILRQPS